MKICDTISTLYTEYIKPPATWALSHKKTVAVCLVAAFVIGQNQASIEAVKRCVAGVLPLIYSALLIPVAGVNMCVSMVFGDTSSVAKAVDTVTQAYMKSIPKVWSGWWAFVTNVAPK